MVDAMKVSRGSVVDRHRLFMRVLIRPSDLDTETLVAHSERVRILEEGNIGYDRMIKRGYNLHSNADEVGQVKAVEDDWGDSEEDDFFFDVGEDDNGWDDDGQDQILLDAVNGQ